MAITVLTGHTSPETAHVTSDYPYGYTLRCQRREWLEFHPKHGYRLVTQTSNPKRPGLVWNKPKASTYQALAVLYLDDAEHVQWATLDMYSALADVERFATAYAAALDGQQEQTILAAIRRQALVADERHQILALMKEMDGKPLAFPAAVIMRGANYVSGTYTFWTSFAERAYVFDRATAEELVTRFPYGLREATVVERLSATA